MDEASDKVEEVFSQEGVTLLSGPATAMAFMKAPGTIYITKYTTPEKENVCIEWKPNDFVTIDSDIQDQEWAVVNTVENRCRTLSGSSLPEEANRSKYLRIELADVKSFKIGKKHQTLAFNDGRGEVLCSFSFQNANSNYLMGVLKNYVKTMASKRDKHVIVVDGEIGHDEKQLEKSFKTLSLFPDEPQDYVWNLVKNFPHRPYETTMEAFSKVTDIVYRSHEQKIDEDTKEVLNRSLIAIESATTTHTQDEYEVVARIPKLPERKECPRGKPLTIEQWKNLRDYDGKIEDIESTKLVIFRGGVTPPLRRKVWKYLLNYYPWDSTVQDRALLIKKKQEEYFKMKTQWRTISKVQEDNFSDYRERKSLIEKDVNRTDRTYSFYEGDNNPNVHLLHDVLMTYAMYNFDLGYVQGMSDLLSPILCLMEDEVDAFWCFVGFMDKVCSNFDVDQAGMKEQLHSLHTLLTFVEPELATYLDNHDSGNMFFCFRWLLVWFKRELNLEDVMKLWEVLWTGLPCKNFHLLLCVATLETEKNALTENNYGFTEILKHINDLSCKLDLSALLNKAEGIYHQIEEAQHATDAVREILGLPLLGNTSADSPNTNSFTYLDTCNDQAVINFDSNEVSFERAISNNYL